MNFNKIKEKNRKDLQNRGEAIKAHYRNLQEQEEAALREKDERLYRAANLQSAAYLKNKHRVQRMNETLEYSDKTVKIGLGIILEYLVEKSLLVDLKEYEEKNPKFRETIKESINEFLDSDAVNLNISDPRTSLIMESIHRAIPDVKTGIYLSEDDVSDIIKKSIEFDAYKAADDISFDVREKVADMVSKEQEDATNLQNELSAITVDGENKSVAIDAKSVAPVHPANTVVEPILQDRIIRETLTRGVIESLALNEAKTLLAEGKDYDKDLVIANSLTYITVLESLNATGLLNITHKDYQKLISK